MDKNPISPTSTEATPSNCSYLQPVAFTPDPPPDPAPGSTPDLTRDAPAPGPTPEASTATPSSCSFLQPVASTPDPPPDLDAPARRSFPGWLILILILGPSLAALVHQKASIIELIGRVPVDTAYEVIGEGYEGFKAVHNKLIDHVRDLWNGPPLDPKFEDTLKSFAGLGDVLTEATTCWKNYKTDVNDAVIMVDASDKLAFTNTGLNLSEGETIKINEMHEAAAKHSDGVRRMAQEYVSIILTIDSFAHEGKTSLRHLLMAYYDGNIPMMASEVDNLRSQLDRLLTKIESAQSHTDKSGQVTASFKDASIRVAQILYKRLDDGEKAKIEQKVKQAEMDRSWFKWFKTFISSKNNQIGEMELVVAEATLAKAFLDPIKRQSSVLLAYEQFLLGAATHLETIRSVVTETQQIVRARLKSSSYRKRRVRQSEEFVRGVDAVRDTFDRIITAVEDFNVANYEAPRRYQSNEPMGSR